MSIAQAQIDNVTETDIYTSVDESAVTSMVFCNTTGSPAQVTIYIIPNGGVAGDDNTIIKNLTIADFDTYVYDTSKFILSNGDKVSAIADAAMAITATISYVSI